VKDLCQNMTEPLAAMTKPPQPKAQHHTIIAAVNGRKSGSAFKFDSDVFSLYIVTFPLN